MSTFDSKPLFSINVFTPKPGRLDDFIAAQLDAVPRFGGVDGLSESRLYRAEDGSRAILVARFESIDAFHKLQNRPAFQAERARLLPLLEGTQPGFYRLIREVTY
ncbi:antibiotic biosynthesis monooxygenase family protein [Pinirhizobacter sp.]|uniref:antibiotic biosynthesis monooxygenase family protein n=1 Tax=Pinirhizobacter sp. TaxID=2950432 RepID=UPI002F3EA885